MLILEDLIYKRGRGKAEREQNVFAKGACHKIRRFSAGVVDAVIDSDVCMKLKIAARGK